MDEKDPPAAQPKSSGRVLLYRAAIVFFILGTFLQIPFTFSMIVYAYHLEHSSLESICDKERQLKEKFGWSYDGDL